MYDHTLRSTLIREIARIVTGFEHGLHVLHFSSKVEAVTSERNQDENVSPFSPTSTANTSDFNYETHLQPCHLKPRFLQFGKNLSVLQVPSFCIAQ